MEEWVAVLEFTQYSINNDSVISSVVDIIL